MASQQAMQKTSTRFICFPRTDPPPSFAEKIVGVFRKHDVSIGTQNLSKGLTSNEVLKVIRTDLVGLGFDVETGKEKNAKIHRPVFFGEDGEPTLRYEIDAYHREWRCGFEVEAARAWMGNAIYRDLVQGLVMVQVDYLVIAVPNGYRYQSGGRAVISSDYSNALSVIETLYGHSRVKLPYSLILIGY
jgi:hypothetical protein